MSIQSVQFGVLTADQIRKLSVREITEPSLYQAGIPLANGPNSLYLGSTDNNRKCMTCNNDVSKCLGHFGHIVLAAPVYNPLFTDTCIKVLRIVCFWCSELLHGTQSIENYKVHERSKKTSKKNLRIISNFLKGKKCTHCEGVQPTYSKDGLGIKTSWKGTVFSTDSERDFATRPFTASRCRDILLGISVETCQTLKMTQSTVQNLVLTVLPVPPVTIRPSVQVSNGSKSRGQGDLTNKLVDILKANIAYRSDPSSKKMGFLQHHVSSYIDKDNSATVVSRSSSIRSLVQRLSGKKGRLRHNLSGKRVDFSSRAVISPAPNMDIDCLGVPKKIADDQTLPVRVMHINYRRMQDLVDSGAAVEVEQKNGNRIKLKHRKLPLTLEVGDVVHRCLRDGDVVIFNRQPTLHKGSIMAHRVKVIEGNSFRLPVACTSPYNADYDGDEMVRSWMPPSQRNRVFSFFL